jgi:hypothetical protein
MLDLPATCNSFEYILSSNSSDFKTSVLPEVFNKLLSTFCNNPKYSGTRQNRSYRELGYNNMVLETSDTHEIKVYTKTTTFCMVHLENFVLVGYERNKLSFHSFPSTKNISYAADINVVSFRVNPKTHVVFEHKKYDNDNGVYYKVFVAHNRDNTRNLDMSHMEKQLKRVLEYIVKAV